MYFIFLVLISLIPICVGVAINVLFEWNRLSKVIFVFLLMVSFWQLDVAFLYATSYLSKDTIAFLFALFRFGTIMVTPTMFYLCYTILKQLPHEQQFKWRYVLNTYTVSFAFIASFIVYIIGWTDGGIVDLKLVQIDHNEFYFPIYGSLNWVFYVNVAMLLACTIICLLVSLDTKNETIRSFLFWFNIFSVIGYLIGALNIFEAAKLYPSSIALMVYTASILILSSKTHLAIVHKMNRQLHEQKNFLFEVINLNPNYIYAKDMQNQYTLMNQSYAQLVGANITEVFAHHEDEEKTLFYAHDRENFEQTIKNQTIEKIFIREELLSSVKGEELWVQTVKVPIDMDGKKTMLAVSTDITERKKFEDTIKHQAYHDALTGLPNRRMYDDDLEMFLAEAKRAETNVAILLLDLDHFKYVNDTLGHDMGDLLLIEVAKRMNRLKQTMFTPQFYRLGGDEFIIILPAENQREIVAFTKALLKAFEDRFLIQENECYITPSIGISIYPKDGQDSNTLIKHADTAMYYVKANGKCGFQLFDEHIQHKFQRRVMVEKQLRKAVLCNEFDLFYQPIVDLKLQQITGVEALLRWNSPILGPVSPDEFIPIAEENGLILSIGSWVMKQAFTQQKQWQVEHNRYLKMGINVSVKQLQDASFIESVRQMIQKSEIDPALITLEITESVAMYDELTIEKLSELKRLGVNLSMDDFGTGYSSLSYLNKYPLDSIKIDKSFIMQMMNDEESKAIVRTIITIAKQLDLDVIAEGVEGLEEYNTLIAMQCDFIQGYYISKPLPARELQFIFNSEKMVSDKIV